MGIIRDGIVEVRCKCGTTNTIESTQPKEREVRARNRDTFAVPHRWAGKVATCG
jgi:hypothetical protein